jgi:4-hydroxybenzoate polyprenyltransferase
LTLAYSLKLKQIVMLDVLVLAGLYTVRIIAGAAAVEVMPSFWLLAFSLFIFLSLAMIKRYSELLVMQRNGQDKAAGRGYHVDDLVMLQSLGAASGYLSVLVLALYINSVKVQTLYSRPEFIWLLCPLLLYWISRTWLKAHRGEMHDDPVIFATQDRVSRFLGVAGGIILWMAL